MDAIETELLAGERRSDARGRKIVSGARRAELLAGYDRSGLTQRAFARKEGINFHTLVVWLQKRKHPAVTPAVRFQEVSVRASASPAPAAVLEVNLPGGLTVRGSDTATVAELVRALTR